MNAEPGIVSSGPAGETATAAGEVQLPREVSRSWWAEAQKGIAEREYQVSQAADAGQATQAYQAPNRAQNIRTFFGSEGITIHDRTAKGSPVLVSLGFKGLERGGRLVLPGGPAEIITEMNRAELRRQGITERYVNRPEGLEQGFEILQRPEGDGELSLLLDSGGAVLKAAGEKILITAASGRQLEYGRLKAVDAAGRAFPGRFEVREAGRLVIAIDDAGARYPLNITPQITAAAADTILERNQAGASFGASVAVAGDENKDGYGDVVVGAPNYDGYATDAGAVFLYLGTSSGVSASPYERLNGYYVGGHFGTSVAGAGDVNGDGYADIVVGEIGYPYFAADGGTFYVFRGSATGLYNIGGFAGDQAGMHMGSSVSGAGDVNGDGYADIVVAASGFDPSASAADGGIVYIYHGSATGIEYATNFYMNQAGASFGSSVSGAGDVNGDGYADIIVGASGYDNSLADEGAVVVYHGSASGLHYATWYVGGQAGAGFGSSVSGAGNVNGDGYADIIVGTPGYDNTVSEEGAAIVFHGSASGTQYATGFVGGQAGARFGSSVAKAGDVDGDGYADIIVGADGYDSSAADEGAAFVFRGSTGGLTGTLAASYYGGQTGSSFGCSVAGAGDVNGDGYADVIVGAKGYDGGQTDEGAAFVFHGITQAPDINLVGNAVKIVDGDATPAIADHTDFGGTDVNGGTVTRTFTIQNTGVDALALGGNPLVAISGANAADFTVSAQPATPIAGGGSTTFQVRFDPSAVGRRVATVTIASNDPNENPYDFAIQGAGVPVGALSVIMGLLLEDPTVQFSQVAASGSESRTPASLVVSLSEPSGLTVTVDYATADGTATAGSDYTASTGTLTFPPGVTSQTISVAISNDTAVEADEAFTVLLSNPSNATLGTATTHTYTINDEDLHGAIQLSAATYRVGEAGPTVTITATRTGGSSGAIGVGYATADGTATAGSDYTAASGTLAWADADLASKTFTVPIAHDALDETDETFSVTLSAPTGSAVLGSPGSGTVTITDFAAPTVQFSQTAYNVLESAAPVSIAVVLSAVSGHTVKVNYATANGTATAGSDYTETAGTLTFNPGETALTITVPIANDTIQESMETFTVALSAPVNASLGASSVSTVSIHDEFIPGLGGLKTIADAIDQAGWTFTTTAGASWWKQSAVTHDGLDAARSGFIADNQVSSFQTTGSFGAGAVTFWWLVSSESGHDFLRFSIDGAVQDSISGEVGWQQKSFPVSAGSHTLKWEYAKDGSGAGGIDAAWVDEVVLPASVVLWSRGDTGNADLWLLNSGALPGALPVTGWTPLTVPTGEFGSWEATGYAHVDASTDYVLWSRHDTGEAILARINPGALPGIPPVGEWAYLGAPGGEDGPWQATSYSHVDASAGYVLSTRSDTGQAILRKIVPGDLTGTIPVTSWAYLKSPAGVGGPWQATSYSHVDETTGYVLWTRSDTGQAIVWKVVPGAVSGTIAVSSWAYLQSSAGVGGPWEATSYTHIDASEGYVLWTRRDTGQAVLWKVVPGDVSGTIPVAGWSYVSSSRGVGGPWRATSYVHGATPGAPVAAGAGTRPLDEVQTEMPTDGALRPIGEPREP